MPTYKCKQCGKQFSLSINPGDCQSCGSSQLIVKGRQSAGANFMVNVSASRKNAKNAKNPQKSIVKDTTPVYSSKAGKPSATATLAPAIASSQISLKTKRSSSLPVSSNFWEIIDPVQIGGILGLLLILVGGFGGGLYWLGNLKFDTKDFQKVAFNESFKTPEKWLLSSGASIKKDQLTHTHAQNKPESISLLKQEQFNDLDVSTEVMLANPKENLASGIATRINGENNQNFYYLMIQADGSFAMGKHTPNNWDDKVAWRKNSAIASGKAVNRLRMVNKDNLIIGFINDKQVGSFEDKDNLLGKIALISHQDKASNSSVTFDNVLIKERETSNAKTNPAKLSLKQVIQSHYQNLENSDEHKSFNFVHNVEIFDQKILKESDDQAQVKMGLRYSLKNGETVCESRVITLDLNQENDQWKVQKSEDIRPQPTCQI